MKQIGIPDEPGIEPKLLEVREPRLFRQLVAKWKVWDEFNCLFKSGYSVSLKFDDAIWSETNEKKDGSDPLRKDKEPIPVNFHPEVSTDGDGVKTAAKKEGEQSGDHAGRESNTISLNKGDICQNKVNVESSNQRDSYCNDEANLFVPVLFQNPTYGDHCPSIKLADKRIGPFTITSEISPLGLGYWRHRSNSCYYCNSQYRRGAIWELIVYGILFLCLFPPAALMPFVQAIIISVWPKSIKYPLIKKCEIIVYKTVFIFSGILVGLIDIAAFFKESWYFSIPFTVFFTLASLVYFLYFGSITSRYSPANIEDFCAKIKTYDCR